MQAGAGAVSNLAVTTAGNGNWNTLAFTGGNAANANAGTAGNPYSDPAMYNNQGANPPTSNSFNIVTYRTLSVPSTTVLLTF